MCKIWRAVIILIKSALYHKQFSTIFSDHFVLAVLVYRQNHSNILRARISVYKSWRRYSFLDRKNGWHECCQQELLAARLNVRVSMDDRSKDRLSNARCCPYPMGPNVMSAQSLCVPHHCHTLSTYREHIRRIADLRSFLNKCYIIRIICESHYNIDFR